MNENPVLIARHFQYRVEMFLQVIVLDGRLGKTQYYAIRVKSQVRGSPNIYSFIWILNAPKLTKFYIDEYTKWFDNILRSDLLAQSMNQYCLNLLKHIKYTIIQRLAENIETKSAGSISVNFL